MVWWYGCPSGNFDPIRKEVVEVVMRGATRSGSGKRNGRWRALPSALLAVQLAVPLSAIQGAHAESATPVGQQMGSKYSTLQQINRDNVADLELAWEYRTGDLPPGELGGSLISFQDQPSLIEGNLVVCSTKRRVVALDPATTRRLVLHKIGRAHV